MAYFGVTPSNVFGQGTKDSFNGDGSTTAFTLSRTVQLATDIEVFVGNVRQEPSVAYTVSGTTLTFAGVPVKVRVVPETAYILPVPLAGVPVKVRVVPETVYATFGSCLTFPTNTSMSVASKTDLLKVNAVVLPSPLKLSLEPCPKTLLGVTPKYAILCYLHNTHNSIQTLCRV